MATDWVCRSCQRKHGANGCSGSCKVPLIARSVTYRIAPHSPPAAPGQVTGAAGEGTAEDGARQALGRCGPCPVASRRDHSWQEPVRLSDPPGQYPAGDDVLGRLEFEHVARGIMTWELL